MVTIALCDDDPAQLRAASELLEEYQTARPDMRLQTNLFSSPIELLEQVSSGKCFDLYLLDIIMPGQNGISLGLELRRLDEQAVIIYLTSSPDYAVESYLTRAFHYLLKPIDKKLFFTTLDNALGQIAEEQNASITFKTKDGLQRLSVHSILFGELIGRRIQFHLTNGSSLESMSLRGSFQAAVAPLLEHQRFVLCTASSVVNLSFVEKVDPDALCLRGGQRLPLSRSFRKRVTDRWMDFYLDGGVSRC